MKSPTTTTIRTPLPETLRVLLIEDSEAEASLLRHQLEHFWGGAVDVTWASDLSEGITVIEEDSPDVILTDLNLPDSDGLRTVEALRLNDDGVPIVVLTGWDDEDTGASAIHHGAQDYLVKGDVDPDAIRRSLRHAIERKRIEERLRGMLQRIRAIDGERRRLLELLVRAEEDERTRLSLELHDGPMQTLAALVLDLSGIRSRLAADGHPEAETLSSKLGLLGGEIATLREMMVNLHPPALDQGGIEAAMHSQARRLADADIACSVDSVVRPRPDQTLELLMYRVVQEAVSNVLKHANARHVAITLRCSRDQSLLRIRDDGVGFTPRASGVLLQEQHLGFRGMQERLEMAGGELTVESAPGAGTTITAALPLAAVVVGS